MKSKSVYCRYVKRGLDIVCASLALIVFCWLYGIIALLVLINFGAPLIFTQVRVGQNQKKFKIYKFRTMTNEKDENGELLPNEVRLTKFGKILRALSLDELPEAWNILKGDMSVVGPRPLLVKYIPRYSEHQNRRHEVKPGLSGWAQVNGRNAVTWEDKFDMDVWYVDNVSFRVDVKVVLLTIKKVLKRDGITAEDSVTTHEFMGSDNNITGD